MITNKCTRCEIESNHKELEKTFPEHVCGVGTNKEDWEVEFDKEFEAKYRHARNPDASEQCKSTCDIRHSHHYHSLDIDKQKEWIKNHFKSLLSTQEGKIFKQLETIDIKMGDPDAEAKVKFAIKAMIRHIKLKKEKDVSTPSINTDSAITE